MGWWLWLKARFPRLHWIPFHSGVTLHLTSQEDKGTDAIAWVKFFTPDSGWTWWASEFDEEDLFFGLVHGAEKELGYFRLSELKQIHGVFGLPVERDRFFKPTPLKALMG